MAFVSMPNALFHFCASSQSTQGETTEEHQANHSSSIERRWSQSTAVHPNFYDNEAEMLE
jgi:hypothetical protein